MTDELLKGNFQVKKQVVEKDRDLKTTVKEDMKRKVLDKLGGSMVYMERTDLTWDGD
jgi:hypothetical protein